MAIPTKEWWQINVSIHNYPPHNYSLNKRVVFFERLLYWLTVICCPSIVLFYLYNKNAWQDILFYHFVIVGGIAAFFSAALYFVLCKFIKRRRSLIVVFLFWLLFWFCVPLHGYIYQFAEVNAIFFAGIFAIAAIAVGLTYIRIDRLIVNTLALTLVALFLYNVAPGVIAAFTNAQVPSTPVYSIKKEFTVDPEYQHPNVYWFHMDGMIGFDMIETYFGDDQSETKAALEKRGFVINEAAKLNAGYTKIAVPTLTSPTLYDSYLGERLAVVSDLIVSDRRKALNEKFFAREGFRFNIVEPYYELFRSFMCAGYNEITIGNPNYGMVPIDYFYQYSNTEKPFTHAQPIINGELDNLIAVLTRASALILAEDWLDRIVSNMQVSSEWQAIEEHSDIVSSLIDPQVEKKTSPGRNERWLVRVLVDAMQIDAPRIIYFQNIMTHMGSSTDIILNEKGEVVKARPGVVPDVEKYLPQHHYSMQLTLKFIDMILEQDPDAVIVMQADHGIHSYTVQSMNQQGYDHDDILALNLSTVSAVRIPEKYGKLSEPLDPLDITRYLVNHFVGENYEYLFYEE